jgi:polyadenylate-binding protein 2
VDRSAPGGLLHVISLIFIFQHRKFPPNFFYFFCFFFIYHYHHLNLITTHLYIYIAKETMEAQPTHIISESEQPAANVSAVNPEVSTLCAPYALCPRSTVLTSSPQDENVEAMKQRLKELQDEADRLQQMQTELHKESEDLREDKKDQDARSIYVGNVDYGTTPEELQQLFQTCGSINRITIALNKYTQHPMGYAYIEFAEPSLVANALVLSGTMFRGRQLKVVPKRTNVPAFMRGGGRGGQRGAPRGYYRGFRGGFRGRGRGGSPY